MDVMALFHIAIPAAGIGHFLILAASAQVPTRLRWQEELSRLSSFNRKLMWVYGSFTVLTIVAFGTLTLFLRQELLRGDRAALALATFIAGYWLMRLLVDFFYFKHDDWPRGKSFVLGHVLLISLFLFLFLVYGGLVFYHLVVGPR